MMKTVLYISCMSNISAHYYLGNTQTSSLPLSLRKKKKVVQLVVWGWRCIPKLHQMRTTHFTRLGSQVTQHTLGSHVPSQLLSPQIPPGDSSFPQSKGQCQCGAKRSWRGTSTVWGVGVCGALFLAGTTCPWEKKYTLHMSKGWFYFYQKPKITSICIKWECRNW